MKKKAFAILTLCISLFAAVALVAAVAAAALPEVAVAAEQKNQPWI